MNITDDNRADLLKALATSDMFDGGEPIELFLELLIGRELMLAKDEWSNGELTLDGKVSALEDSLTALYSLLEALHKECAINA